MTDRAETRYQLYDIAFIRSVFLILFGGKGWWVGWEVRWGLLKVRRKMEDDNFEMSKSKWRGRYGKGFDFQKR